MSIWEQQRRFRKSLDKRRQEYPKSVIGMWKEVMRERIEANWYLVDFRAFRGDCHSHTTHSDGIGTVADNAHFKEVSGMDFLFITDHMGVTQKRECLRHDGIWWGQEPGTQHHHLGILGLNRRYEVFRDLSVDYNEILDRGGVPFIPHPTGWFPSTRYSEEQKQSLDLLGPRFNIEIINGANQVYDCFDVTDAMSIELWDQYLAKGCRVSAMGNSDAHLPIAIGDIWNGVFADELSMEAVMAAITEGNLFVSDAPVLNWTCPGEKAIMGDVIEKKAGSALSFDYVCADSLGIGSVRIIRDGEVEFELKHHEETIFSGTHEATFTGGHASWRLECLATDGRRAYSNPIYVTE